MNISSWVRRIFIGIAVMAVLYVAACTYMWATQLDHVFEPDTVLQTTPDRLGMKFEEVRIPVGSGSEQGELYVWWIPSDVAGAPTMLYFHGNYRNISNNLEHTQRLHNLGYNVLRADYRGFGRSSGGKPNEMKVYEDAEAEIGRAHV